MSVAIHIKFKAADKGTMYIPVATQGAYHTVWLPVAKKLGLKWVPSFENGPTVDVNDLTEVMRELRELHDALASDPKNAPTLERIEYILERLGEVDLDSVAQISIG